MDIFDIIEDEFDEFFDRVTGPRRKPLFRNRSNNMEKYDDTDFKIRFRLSKVAVNYVFSLIHDKITAPTSRNYAITPMDRLLLTLRYYATGSFLTVVVDFTGVSKASASRIVKEFGSCVVLGDNGYENNSYLLTRLSNPRTPAEQLYNQSHIRTRNVVERTFGVWKNRFPVLSKKIILHVSRVQAVIVACAVLHNIAIDMGDEQFEENWPEESDNGEEYHSSTQNTEDSSVRSNIINDYFASLIR
ncbi:unnamed protein product [Colias eurytheme]|nr:unnamed protein product [Colias eurytheme]